MLNRRYVVFLAFGGLALGCSAQVDSDYDGDGAELTDDPYEFEQEGSGEMAEDLPEDAAIAIIWDLYDPEGYQDGVRFGEIVETTGSVPDAFQLVVTEPPRPDFLIEMADGNSLAVARIQWVAKQGFTPEPGGGWGGYGGVRDHVLVYVAQDVALSSVTSEFLHDTPRAGYHISKVDRPEPIACGGSHTLDERGFPRFVGTCPRDQLVPTGADLETMLSVDGSADEILYENLATAW